MMESISKIFVAVFKIATIKILQRHNLELPSSERWSFSSTDVLHKFTQIPPWIFLQRSFLHLKKPFGEWKRYKKRGETYGNIKKKGRCSWPFTQKRSTWLIFLWFQSVSLRLMTINIFVNIHSVSSLNDVSQELALRVQPQLWYLRTGLSCCSCVTTSGDFKADPIPI